jgi:transposase-like protein
MTMPNKPGSQLSKFRRNQHIIALYDQGLYAETIAKQFGINERRVYQIVSDESRRTMLEWSRELTSFGRSSLA